MKIIFFEFLKNLKIIFACSQLFIPPTCKKSCLISLYFGLHKNNKHLDLSISRSKYVYFKSTNFIKFCYFWVPHNTKNFVMKICILIDYNTDCVLIYFHNFLKLETMIFNFKKIGGALVPESQKHFPQENITISFPE
jgi:hypothetical protein